MNKENNSCYIIVAQAISDMMAEQGKSGNYKINLAELSRRTGITRSRLRTMKSHGFAIIPAKQSKKRKSKLDRYASFINQKLTLGITNSVVIYNELVKQGYTGGQSILKEYIRDHHSLVPVRPEIVAKQGNRGRRYTTDPGECFQMDWGFVNVLNEQGEKYQCTCFAMICHHCGSCYVEFFPNAKQENLFIGMIHAFRNMGIPKYVLTDNMKSVVIKRDFEGHPIWQKDYEQFMKTIGFQTKLCKPRHPFTKGKVERLIKYVKENFIVGRLFGTLTDLNIEAENWCAIRNNERKKTTGESAINIHHSYCMKNCSLLKNTLQVKFYEYPLRKISFDGFVNYEGRRFGVPFSYKRSYCRVGREGYYLTIYSDDLSERLCQHNVTWSRKDSFCDNQFSDNQPEETPTTAVTAVMRQANIDMPRSAFDKFDFGKGSNR